MQTLLRTYGYHYKSLIQLGVPIVIGQIGNIILGFADTLMVGHHSMQELAAASFINSLFMLFVIFAMGFSYGLTPVAGSLYGRGERGEIGPVVRDALAANTLLASVLLAFLIALYLGLPLMGQPKELLPLMRPYLLVNIISIPFVCWGNTFKQFFDAIGHTKTPMCVLLGGNVLNIFGNWVLIYGKLGMPELGLLGAGLSTMISRIVMAAAFAVLFFAVKRYKVYARGFLSGGVSRQGFSRMNALGWPLGLQMGMESAAFSLTAVMVGWIGTTALAAHQIMLTVSQIFYMVYYGMAAAVAVRVSYYRGAGEPANIRLTANAGFHLILAVAVLVSIPVFLLRGVLSTWFTDSAQVCLLVSQTVIMLIVYQLGDGMQCTFANALRGLSCVKPMMWISFFSYFIVSLPLSWLFGIHLGYGLVGVWAAFPICLMTAGVLYYVVFRRVLAREQKKSVMQNPT